jgi:DNA polymerase I
MLKAFEDGVDLHARTAEVMFGLKKNSAYLKALESGVTPKEWTDETMAIVNGKVLSASYRSIAKTINFGLLYGMGATRLASKLRIDMNTARELLRLYKETYAVAINWLTEQGNRIERPQDGRVYAVTVGGRRRWFEVPEFKLPRNVSGEEAREAQDKHKRTIAGIRRQLGNHPIQGSSSDITKYAIALWQRRGYNCKDMRLVATVHDELLIEVLDEPEIVELSRRRLGEVMESALRKYLKHVTIRPVGGKTSHYWNH